MIKVFVASNEKWSAHEPVLRYSIESNTDAQTNIVFVHPRRYGMEETGCTSFTNVRWAVPELAGHEGYAIYLDTDMLVLGDIADLFSFREAGKFVCLADGSTEVMVMDCSIVMPPKSELHHYSKPQLLQMAGSYLMPRIPLSWNVEDSVTPDARLIHFTDLSRQPWFTPERNDLAVQVLREYESKLHG